MKENKKYKLARELACQFLKNKAIEKQLSYQDIADKTGFMQSAVSRMLNAKFAISYDNLLVLAESIDSETYNNLINTFKN